MGETLPTLCGTKVCIHTFATAFLTSDASMVGLLNMDSDFIERLRRVSLTPEEGEVIQVRSENRKKILEECSLSLVGRFLTSKTINLRAAKNLLWSVWKMGNDLKITDVGDGLVQFKFSLESQLVWVLNNGPWSFDNHLLLLRQGRRG